MTEHASFQNEIYLQGLAGQVPDVPMTFDGLEALARERMVEAAYDYVIGGAGMERTMAANRRAFDRWQVVPRMMVDVSERDTSVEVLGTSMSSPVLTAPVGQLGEVAPEGELAVTRAAADLGLTSILSTASSSTIEDVGEVAGDAPHWFQLYWPSNRDVATSLVRRAEAAGFGAIVVTLDTKLLGWRPRDLAHANLPFLREVGLDNYKADPAFTELLAEPWEDNPQMGILTWVANFADRTLTWDDLAWLVSITDLPVLAKGVQHPDDARAVVNAGAAGMVVSNHGGRQVDNAVGSLTMLPEVVEAVGDDAVVLFDSGIRSGADVFTALCLGADAVLVGRPWVYGLGIAGEDGVRHVLRSILAEFDLTMALTGQTSVADLGPHLLRAAT